MAPGTDDMSDDELFDLIGAVGSGMGVAKDSTADPEIQALGQHVADSAAAKLADKRREN